MTSRIWFCVPLALWMLAIGCAPQADDATSVTAKETAPAEEPAQATSDVETDLSDLATAPDVVNAFLTAMKEGDRDRIMGLMSQKAQDETNKNSDLAIQPPGSPSAKYKIGDTQMVRGMAHVDSTWTESDFSGGSIEFPVVWVLREEKAGWRVAGMKTPLREGEPPLYLDFEDPAGMLAALEAVHDSSTQDIPATARQPADGPAATQLR